jgi:WD40 repeat protein
MNELTAGSSTGKARQSNWESFDIKRSLEGTRKTHPTHQTYLAACLANTAVMASTSTQPIATADNLILTPVMTLDGHEPWRFPGPSPDGEKREYKHVSYISYFPDGKQMISGSRDKTIRRWDLRKGKEIKKDREVYEDVQAVGVSRDGRWIVIAGQKGIKVNEVETGIVRTFQGGLTICIDISTDSTLLAGGSYREVRIWNLDTGELVAGPFDIQDFPDAPRISEDSRKLALSSYDVKERHRYLQVCQWDVQTHKSQRSTYRGAAGVGCAITEIGCTKTYLQPCGVKLSDLLDNKRQIHRHRIQLPG